MKLILISLFPTMTKEEENNTRNALKNHFVFKDINKSVLD